MEYNVRFKKSVAKDLQKIQKEQIEKILQHINDELRLDPMKHSKLKGKFEGLRKFRIGNYRVIYSILSNDILILRISHRKEAYS